MTEALIDHLSTLKDLRVVSRTSVMQFSGSRKPASEIARELNVDALVEGAIMQSADRVRISVRLIRGGSEITYGRMSTNAHCQMFSACNGNLVRQSHCRSNDGSPVALPSRCHAASIQPSTKTISRDDSN